MRFTDAIRRLSIGRLSIGRLSIGRLSIRRLSIRRFGVLATALVAGCSSTGSSDRAAPAERAEPTASRPTLPPSPTVELVAPSPSVAKSAPVLAAPGPVRSMAEVRQQAALRMMAANPERVYHGKVPDPLLAIPVLEIELNGDGSIRRIEVLRSPREAKDTLQLAADAVRRAAPFGDVSRLPRPWKFVETFLFNDERKFKPRTLDV